MSHLEKITERIADKIQQGLKHPDQRADQLAYRFLELEVKHFCDVHSAAKTKEFTQQLSKDLTEKGLLPDLSVGWLAEHKHKLSLDKDATIDMNKVEKVLMQPKKGHEIEQLLAGTVKQEHFAANAQTHSLPDAYTAGRIVKEEWTTYGDRFRPR